MIHTLAELAESIAEERPVDFYNISVPLAECVIETMDTANAVLSGALPDQRIRIEALRAACMMSGTHPAGLTPATILSSAEQFRAWLEGGS